MATTTAPHADRLAVVYDRASTAHQRDNYSRADAARLVQLAEGCGYLATLRQEIKSGEDLVNRPVMRQLLQDVADGKVQAVVVQHLDRLSRDQDQIDGRIIRQILRDNGCVVITPEKTYDFEADADDDLADVQFLMAKFQKRSNIRQMVTGMKEQARQGKRLPSVLPLGYDAVFTPAERPNAAPIRDLARNEEEAALVRRIFDLYEQHSERKAAAILNSEGLRWPVKNPTLQAKYGGRSERPFQGGDVHAVVQREMYAGFVVWGKRKQSRHLRDFDAQRVFRPDLQIVSIEQWNRAQRIRAERSQLPPRSVFSSYLFSGLLKCRRCGGAMIGWPQRTKGTTLYRCCRHHASGRAACEGQRLPETAARRAAVAFLQHLFTEQIVLERFIEGAARRYGIDKTDEEAAQEIRAELQAIEMQKRNLVDAVAGGLLRGDEVRAKNMELEEARERLERRLAAAGSRRQVRAEITAAVRLLEGEGLAARIAQLPDDALRRLCRMVFRRFSLVGADTGRARRYEVASYELTAEFADLVAHHGTHADNFDSIKVVLKP